MCVKRAGSLRRQVHQAPGAQEFGISVFRFKRAFALQMTSCPQRVEIGHWWGCRLIAILR